MHMQFGDKQSTPAGDGDTASQRCCNRLQQMEWNDASIHNLASTITHSCLISYLCIISHSQPQHEIKAFMCTYLYVWYTGSRSQVKFLDIII